MVFKEPNIDSYSTEGKRIQINGKLEFTDLSFKYSNREVQVLGIFL